MIKKMNIVKELPEELQRIVLDFWYSMHHKQNMMRVIEELPLKAIQINKRFSYQILSKMKSRIIFVTHSVLRQQEYFRIRNTLKGCPCSKAKLCSSKKNKWWQPYRYGTMTDLENCPCYWFLLDSFSDTSRSVNCVVEA